MGASRSRTERFVFNRAKLAAVPVPTKTRIYVHDKTVPGLCLCVTPAGSRSFYVYRWCNGGPQRIRLGAFPQMTVEQARNNAKGIIGDIARGADPAAERRKFRTVPTVADLYIRWKEVYATGRVKTLANLERQFQVYLLPFHKRRLNTLTPQEIAAWHSKVGEEHGRYSANRALQLLRSLYNRSREVTGYECPNPCRGTRMFKEVQRDRFLQEHELRAFFAALDGEPEVFRDFYMMAVLTGARRGNLEVMRFEDVDCSSGVWRIPETKAGVPIVVPLAEHALSILRRRHAARGESPWVFALDNKAGHVRNSRDVWCRILATAKLADLRPHDLRRTLGSWQAIQGASLPIIGKSLGHTSLRATTIYARLSVDSVRDSVERATSAIVEAGNGGKGNG